MTITDEDREDLAYALCTERTQSVIGDDGEFSLVRMDINDAYRVADLALAWFAARSPQAAPSVSVERVTSLADALRSEITEHGSDGSTFEAVIRACSWPTCRAWASR